MPPFGPDFYAISKMVHYISVLQKLAKLLTNYQISPILLEICSNCSGDTINTAIFTNSASIYPLRSILSADKVFRPNSYV